MFDDAEGPRVRDVCAGRHGGNPESVAAFERVAPTLNETRAAILEFARSRKTAGVTVHDVCKHFGKTPNEVSGRLTELKSEEFGFALRDSGRRKDGAKVLVAAEFLSEILADQGGLPEAMRDRR